MARLRRSRAEARSASGHRGEPSTLERRTLEEQSPGGPESGLLGCSGAMGHSLASFNDRHMRSTHGTGDSQDATTLLIQDDETEAAKALLVLASCSNQGQDKSIQVDVVPGTARQRLPDMLRTNSDVNAFTGIESIELLNAISEYVKVIDTMTTECNVRTHVILVFVRLKMFVFPVPSNTVWHQPSKCSPLFLWYTSCNSCCAKICHLLATKNRDKL